MKVINFITDHTWALIALISAIFIAVGAFKSSIDQKKAENKAKDLQNELVKKAKEISDLQKLTIELQSENNSKLQKQNDYLTGGKSYPTLVFNSNSDKPHIFEPMIWVSGTNPLYNLSMTVKNRNIKNNQKDFNIELDEIRQITPKYFDKSIFYDIEKEPNLKLIIRFSARNGGWDQHVEFRKVKKGEYQYKTKLISHYGSKTPIVDKDFNDSGIKLGKLSDINSLSNQ